MPESHADEPCPTTTGDGPWDALLVHGNEDAVTGTFDTIEAATAWARTEDAKRHPEHRSVLDLDRYQSDGFIQYGTGYHYVCFTRPASDTAEEAARV